MKFKIRPQKATFSTENIYIKKKKNQHSGADAPKPSKPDSVGDDI